MGMKDWIKVQFTPTDNENKVAELIKELYKTHDVTITESGTIYIKKHETNSRKN